MDWRKPNPSLHINYVIQHHYGIGNIKALGTIDHNGVELHNLYAEMDLVFPNPFIVVL